MSRFESAKAMYAEIGVDVEAALLALQEKRISMHCWQGDDVSGFENSGSLDGGIAATGNYPGKARNPDELFMDIDTAMNLIPGDHKINVHACYAVSDEKPDRDALQPKHFKAWLTRKTFFSGRSNSGYFSESLVKCAGRAISVVCLALLVCMLAAAPAMAEELDGNPKTLYLSDFPSVENTDWNYNSTAYSNSGALATLKIDATSNLVKYRMKGAITGAIDIVGDFGGALTNNTRLELLNNTANAFTGSITMNGGILYTINVSPLCNRPVTLKDAVLMVGAEGKSFPNTFTLDGFGGFRPSSTFTVTGDITGNGDLLVTPDGTAANARHLLMDSPAGTAETSRYTYEGTTSIGVYRESVSTNAAAQLRMGQDYLLPQTTVVEIGASLNPLYTYKPATADAVFHVNGKTQNIAGLYGTGTVTGGSGTLNINPSKATVAIPEGQGFTGTLSGVNINLVGSGTQLIGGGNNASQTRITVSDDTTLIMAKSAANTLASYMTVNDGATAKIVDGNTTQQLISWSLTVNAGGVVDMNGGELRAAEGIIGGGQIIGGGTLIVRMVAGQTNTFSGELSVDNFTKTTWTGALDGAGTQILALSKPLENTNVSVTAGTLEFQMTDDSNYYKGNTMSVETNGTLKLTNTGTGDAVYAGVLASSGGGIFESDGVDYVINLDDWLGGSNTIWDGLDASTGMTFSDGTTFTFTSGDWESLVGETFSLFEGMGSPVTGNLNFAVSSSPYAIDWSADPLGNGWGISINGATSSATPEPATWVMLVLGAGGLYVLRRRKSAGK